jgi:hypothetical protein
MKITACIALHYGREYLRWVIRGIAPVVDRIHIFYAPSPTFGHAAGGLLCPDTLFELQHEAEVEGAGKIVWHEVRAVSEEAHRTFMLRQALDDQADVMVIVDADEVWDPADLEVTVRAIHDHPQRATRWLTRFANFWRSFDWMVDDSFRPVRFVDLRVWGTPHSDAYLDEAMQPGPIYHFGYAQRAELMRYKMACHGHKNEFRPGWLEEKFFGWKPGDVDAHPCVNNLWTPRPTDPATRAVLARLLHDHPYQDLAVIP